MIDFTKRVTDRVKRFLVVGIIVKAINKKTLNHYFGIKIKIYKLFESIKINLKS